MANKRIADLDPIGNPSLTGYTIYDDGSTTFKVTLNNLSGLGITGNTGGADLIINLNNLSTMQDPTDISKYQDGVHPTTLGHSLIAGYITPILESFIATL